MVERLEDAFSRPLPTDLGQVIDDRVRAAMAGTPRRVLDDARGAESPVPPGSNARPARGVPRRGRVVLLGVAAVLMAVSVVVAGALSREAPRPPNPRLVEAMQGVADQMMARCLDKAQATELITSTLKDLGETGWSIRTDGPLAYPIGKGDEVAKHIAAGCFVYSSSGGDDVGRPVIFISGP